LTLSDPTIEFELLNEEDFFLFFLSAFEILEFTEDEDDDKLLFY